MAIDMSVCSRVDMAVGSACRFGSALQGGRGEPGDFILELGGGVLGGRVVILEWADAGLA